MATPAVMTATSVNKVTGSMLYQQYQHRMGNRASILVSAKWSVLSPEVKSVWNSLAADFCTPK
jgi:hypothetical protein